MDTVSLGINIASSLRVEDLPSARIKTDELFLEWLTLKDTTRLLDHLLEEISALPDKEIEDHLPRASEVGTLSQPPPLSPTNRSSPKKRSQSEMLDKSNQRKGAGEHLSDAVSQLNFESSRISEGGRGGADEEEGDEQASAQRQRSNVDSIPVFFVPKRGHRSRKPIAEDELISKLSEIESHFKAYPSGIPFESFVHITKGLCGLPSFFNLPLCRRIVALFPSNATSSLDKNRPLGPNGPPQPSTKISLKVFLQFWQKEIEPFDRYERFFRLVKQPDSSFICKDDFVPFIQELLHFHPGLEFFSVS